MRRTLHITASHRKERMQESREIGDALCSSCILAFKKNLKEREVAKLLGFSEGSILYKF